MHGLRACRRVPRRAEGAGGGPRQGRARHRLRLPTRRGELRGHRSPGPALPGRLRRARRPRREGPPAPGARGCRRAGAAALDLVRGARRGRRRSPPDRPGEDRAPPRERRLARRQDHDRLRGRCRWTGPARHVRRQAAQRRGLSRPPPPCRASARPTEVRIR